MKDVRSHIHLQGMMLIALCQHQQYDKWVVLLVFLPELGKYKTGVWHTTANCWAGSEDHQYKDDAWFKFVQRSTTSIVLGDTDASN